MRFIFCLILILHFSSYTYAQDKKPELVTGDFRGVSISEFVRQVEAQTSFHFFYDPAVFDLVVINTEIKGLSLSEALDRIFASSEYSFSIDQNRVFLLKGGTIKTGLPPALISMVKDSAYWKAKQKELNESGYGSNSATARSGFENKLYEVGLKTNEIKPGNAILNGVIVRSHC